MKKTYIIQGMHCNSCSLLVTDALKELNGVKNAKVSYEKGEAIVDFDEKIVDSKKIINEIKKAGYKSEELIKGKKNRLFRGLFK